MCYSETDRPPENLMGLIPLLAITRNYSIANIAYLFAACSDRWGAGTVYDFSYFIFEKISIGYS